MYVSLCFVLPPENWSVKLPNKGNSLLTYFTYLRYTSMVFDGSLQKIFLELRILSSTVCIIVQHFLNTQVSSTNFKSISKLPNLILMVTEKLLDTVRK